MPNPTDTDFDYWVNEPGISDNERQRRERIQAWRNLTATLRKYPFKKVAKAIAEMRAAPPQGPNPA